MVYLKKYYHEPHQICSCFKPASNQFPSLTFIRKLEQDWNQCDQIGRFFMTIFLTKVAQIFCDILASLQTHHFLSKNCCCCCFFWDNFWKKLGYFIFQHLIRTNADWKTYSAFRMNGELHFKASFKWGHLGDVFESKFLLGEGVDRDCGVADEPKFRFPNGQVVDGILVTRSDEARILIKKTNHQISMWKSV